MKFLLALKLFGFVIGAVLQFSLFILIQRYRRIEKLEILFLSLITCLFFWNFCNFLSLLFTTTTPLSTFLLSLGVDSLAFCVLAFLPPLLLHTHLVFQQQYLTKPLVRLNWIGELAVYCPLALLPSAFADFLNSYPATSILAATTYARPFAGWFIFSLVACALLEWKMLQQSQKPQEQNLFRVLIIIFLVVAGLVFHAYFISDFQVGLKPGGYLEALLMLWSIIPSALLGYHIFRYNFLEIAIQRSIGYSFAGILLVLIYLLSVRWLRDFLEEAYSFPGLVVEAGMILALFAFLQPLKRWIDTSVNSLFSLEISKFQRMASRLDEVSRSTVEVEKLLRFIEELLQKELELKAARIVLYPESSRDDPLQRDVISSEAKVEKFLLLKGHEVLGELRVQGQSDKLSTEQHAALRFLVTQIVAAIENCRLGEGKIRLERELAERDKMATLGQMAATVAHNIKNPLSSIKTIVQLMQEDDEIAVKYARDLSLINSEVDRLSNSVVRLLKFSKPTVSASANIDLAEVLEKTLSIFRPEADRKGILLQLELTSRPLTVCGSEEVLSEIFQNLIVNAVEVSPERSRVIIKTDVVEASQGKKCLVTVEDEGPGISSEIRQHIFKPFFTTKQKGTGLGLAVVQRRVLDLGGEIDCISPLSPKGGTRFEVTLPLVN